MAWRNCNASISLINATNARWPNRDKASDGTIGDANHQNRTSDHNPWIVVDGIGVVRARDIDKDGIDAAWLAEELRKAGAAGDSRLTGGGYVIFNRRITTPNFSGWKAYTGSNPHTAHIHVSFSQNRAGFDRTDGWSFISQQNSNGGVIDDMYDSAARAELLGILARIERAAVDSRPFTLYRMGNPKEPGYGSVILAGEGVWLGIPTMVQVGLIQKLKLAGEMVNVDSQAELDFARLTWSRMSPKVEVDTKAIIDKLNAAAAQIRPEDLAAIADAVNDEDDRRDRDGDSQTGATS